MLNKSHLFLLRNMSKINTEFYCDHLYKSITSMSSTVFIIIASQVVVECECWGKPFGLQQRWWLAFRFSRLGCCAVWTDLWDEKRTLMLWYRPWLNWASQAHNRWSTESHICNITTKCQITDEENIKAATNHMFVQCMYLSLIHI